MYMEMNEQVYVSVTASQDLNVNIHRVKMEDLNELARKFRLTPRDHKNMIGYAEKVLTIRVGNVEMKFYAGAEVEA